MPTINDMMEVADLFRVEQIEVVQEACVAVRNRNSTCRRCMDACAWDALSLEDGRLVVDGGACVNCGACVAVCPMGCLSAVDPSLSAVRSATLAAARAAGGVACIACARKAARHEADPELFCEVPCLAQVGEELLLRVAADGVQDIMLVDGGCATCKYGQVNSLIDEAVETAVCVVEAVETAEVPAIVTRSSEFPPELANTFRRDVRGADRRGLMAQTGSYLRTVAGNVAQKTIEEKLSPQTPRPKKNLKLKEKVPAAQNMRLLDDMLTLGASCVVKRGEADAASGVDMTPRADAVLGTDMTPGVEGRAQVPHASNSDATVLDTRHFGTVRIDESICSGCGLCVLACPTEALKYAEYDEPADPGRRYLEFQAADCTQCQLCRDVCLRRCLTVSSQVPVEELFDFEPTLIEIPRPMERMNILNKYRHT